jgi:hypothetical protein
VSGPYSILLKGVCAHVPHVILRIYVGLKEESPGLDPGYRTLRTFSITELCKTYQGHTGHPIHLLDFCCNEIILLCQLHLPFEEHHTCKKTPLCQVPDCFGIKEVREKVMSRFCSSSIVSGEGRLGVDLKNSNTSPLETLNTSLMCWDKARLSATGSARSSLVVRKGKPQYCKHLQRCSCHTCWSNYPSRNSYLPSHQGVSGYSCHSCHSCMSLPS